MRRLFVSACALLVCACNKDPGKENTAPSSPAVASPASGGPIGADGGGDGTSLARAKPIPNGGNVAFRLACDARMYLGPFTMTKPQQTLTLMHTVKTPTGKQLCIGGEWLDASGKRVEGGGLGCVDGTFVGEGKVSYAYEPNSGGASAKVVYLAVNFAEPKPEGCPSAEVTLKLP